MIIVTLTHISQDLKIAVIHTFRAKSFPYRAFDEKEDHLVKMKSS